MASIVFKDAVAILLWSDGQAHRRIHIFVFAENQKITKNKLFFPKDPFIRYFWLPRLN